MIPFVLAQPFLPTPVRETATIALAIRAPELDPDERADLPRLVAAMGSRSGNRTPADVRAAFPDGLSASVAGDVVILRAEVPPTFVRASLNALLDLVRDPWLESPPTVELAPPSDPLSRWLSPPASLEFDARRLRALHARLLDPDAMRLAAPPEALPVWREWVAALPKPARRDRYRRVLPVRTGPDESRAVRLPLPPVAPGTEVLRMAETLVLGGGKDGLLYRAVREGAGLSYRQEVVWSPERGGFRPVIVLASADPEAAAKARAALLAAVETLGPADLARAVGTARAAFALNLPLSPFRLGPDGEGYEDPEGRASVRAVWSLLSPTPWPEDWPARLASLSLEEVKASLRRSLGA